ncbi:MAG: hypothetical protein JWN24_1934 [Phycisphaerales bacterium]|nr:hypothetical protein [Phycisphaerales bacterium]
MDTTSSNGGSQEPIPTSPNLILPGSSSSEDASAGSDVTAPSAGGPPADTSFVSPVPVEVQAVAPPTLPMTSGLSAQQQTALAALASGMLPGAAAQAAGVVASTLYRWRRKDPAFIAALNAWRNHAQESARDRVLAMAGQATATVLAAMQKGDARTAMTILKGLGAIAPAALGPESVIGVRRVMDRDASKQYVDVQNSRIELRDARNSVARRATGQILIEEDKLQAEKDAAE